MKYHLYRFSTFDQLYSGLKPLNEFKDGNFDINLPKTGFLIPKIYHYCTFNRYKMRCHITVMRVTTMVMIMVLLM